MLSFQKLSLDQKSDIDRYMYAYGENSCQHSFSSMFCLQGKYDDRVCFSDGWLYVFRAGRTADGYRRYMFPMGDRRRENELRCAVGKILDDAHENGCRVCFETLTVSAWETLNRLYPGQFEAVAERDLAEYIYETQKIVDLPGKALKPKRYELHTFFRDHGDRAAVEPLTEKHFSAILDFQTRWLNSMEQTDNIPQLEYENEAIRRALDNFEALELRGVVVLLDGKLCGYAYGARLSDDCFDFMVEKGDRNVSFVYRVLHNSMARACCEDCRCINFEEDLGVEGLRRSKLAYRPDHFIEKYLVREL